MIEAEEGESSMIGFSFCDGSKVLIHQLVNDKRQ